ncbi:MAG: hypothetical protein GY751_09935 [Bacteroidetes bacterium]|nr:hypothetical protein [Bacteroidota bacterium]
MKQISKLWVLIAIVTMMTSCEKEDVEEFSFELNFTNSTIHCITTTIQYFVSTDDSGQSVTLNSNSSGQLFVAVDSDDFIDIEAYDLDNGGAILDAVSIPTDGYVNNGTIRLLVNLNNCGVTPKIVWITQ